MKRLAFVDYRLDNFHANTFRNLLSGELSGNGWTLAGCHALDAAEGEAWAATHQIPYFANAADLATMDGLLLLAPSNPETHLELAQRCFPLGRPVYVDKTFAPDLATAQALFALADQNGIAIQTTSALRYGRSIDAALAQMGGREALRHVHTWGGGQSVEEYAIHPLEMAVSLMGAEVEAFVHLPDGAGHHEITLRYSGGRSAQVIVQPHSKTAFQAMLATAGETRHVSTGSDPIFTDLLRNVLAFLDTGVSTIDRHESLLIREILDTVCDPAQAGVWITR